MVAGIELGKQYIQVCVKTESMREPETITQIIGSEQYNIPIEVNFEKEEEVEGLFRKIWKMLAPYGSKEALKYVIFCLEENTEELRSQLAAGARVLHIPKWKLRFMDKNESFCTYVMNHREGLLSRHALLVENRNGEKTKSLLHKHLRYTPPVTAVEDVSGDSMENIFSEYAISSVFLVGDDFEEEWMQENRALLKKGKRVFAGKNLFVMGALYRGLELLKGKEDYLYLDENKVCCNIGLKTEKNGAEEILTVVEAGKNWYESDTSLMVLLLEEPVVEFVIVPIDGREKKVIEVALEGLPVRPKKTTRLLLDLWFKDPVTVNYEIRDLGFGELFPGTDMIYEGEMQWEQ